MSELVEKKEDLIRYFEDRRQAARAMAGRHRVRKGRGPARDGRALPFSGADGVEDNACAG